MFSTISATKDFRRDSSAARSALGSARRANPLVLWHLLSLDAPTVAALWTWFLARANHVRLPGSTIFAMGVAVWMLYASDRLLDTRTVRGQQELEERHYFHRRHSLGFATGIVVAAFVLAVLLRHLATNSFPLYLVLGGVLFAYFVLIHSPADTRRLPKEIAVGVFFSAATFIPTISSQPGLRTTLLPAAILLAILCSLNCLFIYAWEHPGRGPDAHRATQAALRALPFIALGAVLAGLALTVADHCLRWQIPAACVLSSAILLLLHRSRYSFAPITLRAAADLSLLTPLLLLPVLN